MTQEIDKMKLNYIKELELKQEKDEKLIEGLREKSLLFLNFLKTIFKNDVFKIEVCKMNDYILFHTILQEIENREQDYITFIQLCRICTSRTREEIELSLLILEIYGLVSLDLDVNAGTFSIFPKKTKFISFEELLSKKKIKRDKRKLELK